MPKRLPIEETIAAISTPPGAGGIAIVRISGAEAIAVGERLFSRPLRDVPSHRVLFGTISDPDTGNLVDEVLLTLMRGPKTYTREDVVELNCHGGPLVTQRILQLCLKHGARLAEPGEFTKRAFLNGRVDLSQAEAVMDVIDAKTQLSREAAAYQLSGRLREKIAALRSQVLDMVAAIEAAIDYPEHDVEEETYGQMERRTEALLAELEKLLADAEGGRILRDGLSVAILGKPNVGKSSLLNRLLDTERAIVTDIPGTTRDSLEEFLNLGGVPVKLIDTAGIRETGDQVERIGVERSWKYAQEADLLLLVLDGSRPLEPEDRELLALAETKRVLVLVNKTDLPQQIELPVDNVLKISVKADTGLEELTQAIQDLFFGGTLQKASPLVTNVRHQTALEGAKEALLRAMGTIRNRMPEDFISFDLQDVLYHLGEITGDTADEEIIDRIFTKFCLGK